MSSIQSRLLFSIGSLQVQSYCCLYVLGPLNNKAYSNKLTTSRRGCYPKSQGPKTCFNPARRWALVETSGLIKNLVSLNRVVPSAIARRGLKRISGSKRAFSTHLQSPTINSRALTHVHVLEVLGPPKRKPRALRRRARCTTATATT